jgi:hypothetical protein
MKSPIVAQRLVSTVSRQRTDIKFITGAFATWCRFATSRENFVLARTKAAGRMPVNLALLHMQSR